MSTNLMIVLSRDFPVVFVPWGGGELVRRISLRDCSFNIWEDPSDYGRSVVRILHPVTGASASVLLSDLELVASGERRYSPTPTTAILRSMLRQRKVVRILRTWRAVRARAREEYETQEAERTKRLAVIEERHREALGSEWGPWVHRMQLPPIDPHLDPHPPRGTKWATRPSQMRALARNNLIWAYIDGGGEKPWPVVTP